jgi:Iron-dependent Transcriptional regulator
MEQGHDRRQGRSEVKDSLLAMCAVLEIAQHERERLRAVVPEPPKKPRKNARKPKPVLRPAPTRAIAKRLTGFDRGLQLLIPRLVDAGILVGRRGRGGGHLLGRGESEITLRQIHEVVEKPNFSEVGDRLAVNIPAYAQWIVDVARIQEMTSLGDWTVATVLDNIDGNEARGNGVYPIAPESEPEPLRCEQEV